jgi:THO complex subunit 1
MVEQILSRDKNWVRWKTESCPPIVREPMQPELYNEAKVGAERAYATKRLRPAPLGALDLSFLAEAEASSGMERLKQPDR